jgi:glycosyltransferase involved in cell wall biosynthesis
MAGAGGPVTPGPFLSAVVRTQGRRPGALGEALASLAAQEDDDFEVIVVVHAPDGSTVDDVRHHVETSARPGACRIVSVTSGGRGAPLNAGADAAHGRYVAFLDDDDLALPGWVGAYRRGAEAAPGRVVRTVTLEQPCEARADEDSPAAPLGPPVSVYARTFDHLQHLHHNETPICAVALPLDELRAAGLRFDEALPVLEDWDLLLRAASRLGVVSIDEETAIYRKVGRGGSRDLHDDEVWDSTRRLVLSRLDAEPLVLPPGSVARHAEAVFTYDGPPWAVGTLEDTRRWGAQVEAALNAQQRRADDLERQLAAPPPPRRPWRR